MGVSPGRPLTTDHVRISFFQSLPNPLDLTIMVLICSGFSSVFCLLLRVVWESLSIKYSWYDLWSGHHHTIDI